MSASETVQRIKRGAIPVRLRFDTLAKCGFRCHYCGASADEEALVVDHVVPVAAGGQTEPSNLVAACKPCNDGKSSKLLTCPPVPASLPLKALRIGRPPLARGSQTRMVPMRWSQGDIDRIQVALREGEDRSAFIRTAVEAELKRRGK